MLIHTLLQTSRVQPFPEWKDWNCWGFLGYSYPALSVSKGQVWENWEMLLPPQLTLHWKARAQELSRIRFHTAFSAAPAKTKEYWEKGGVVLSVIQPTGFPQG